MDNCPFDRMLEKLHDPKYYCPEGSAFMKDASSVLGQIFEELIRHYPVLLPIIIDAVIKECKIIIDLSTKYSGDRVCLSLCPCLKTGGVFFHVKWCIR